MNVVIILLCLASIARAQEITFTKKWSYASNPSLRCSSCFSQNGKYVATAGVDHFARLWDLGTGYPEQSLHGGGIYDIQNWIYSMVFVANDSLLITGGAEGDILVWDVQTCTQTNGIFLFGFFDYAKVYDLVAVPGGKVFVAATDSCVYVCHADSTSELFVLGEQTRGAKLVALAGDYSIIVVGQADGSVSLWNIDTGQLITTWTAYNRTLNSLTVSENSKCIAVTAEGEYGIKVWNYETDQSEVLCSPLHNPIACYAADDGFIAAQKEDRRVYLLSADGTILKSVDVMYGVNKIEVSPDGLYFVPIGDGYAKVYQTADLDIHFDMEGTVDVTYQSVLMSKNAERVMLIGESQYTDMYVIVFDVKDRTQVWQKNVSSSMTDIVLSEEGKYVAIATDDDGVEIWNIDNGQRVWSVPVFSESGLKLALSSKDSTLYYGGVTGVVKKVHWFDDDILKVYDGSSLSAVDKVRLSNSKNMVVTIHGGSGIVWRESDGQLLSSVDMNEVEFSQDDSFYIVNPSDSWVVKYDASTHQLVSESEYHGRYYQDIMLLNSDQQVLAVSYSGVLRGLDRSWDKVYKQYQLLPNQVMAEACGNSGKQDVVALLYYRDNLSIYTCTYEPVGVNELIQIPDDMVVSTLFPNPADRNGAVSIEYILDVPSTISITVCDALGRTVKQQSYIEPLAGTKTARLNIDGVHSGVYFYRVAQSGEVIASGKLMVR